MCGGGGGGRGKLWGATDKYGSYSSTVTSMEYEVSHLLESIHKQHQLVHFRLPAYVTVHDKTNHIAL